MQRDRRSVGSLYDKQDEPDSKQELLKYPDQNRHKGILDKIMKFRDAWPFLQPVSAVEVPDYYEKIKNPMDLGTVKNKLLGNEYETGDQFVADVRLVFKNALEYNAPETRYYAWATKLSQSFERELVKMEEQKVHDEVKKKAKAEKDAQRVLQRQLSSPPPRQLSSAVAAPDATAAAVSTATPGVDASASTSTTPSSMVESIPSLVKRELSTPSQRSVQRPPPMFVKLSFHDQSKVASTRTVSATQPTSAPVGPFLVGDSGAAAPTRSPSMRPRLSQQEQQMKFDVGIRRASSAPKRKRSGSASESEASDGGSDSEGEYGGQLGPDPNQSWDDRDDGAEQADDGVEADEDELELDEDGRPLPRNPPAAPAEKKESIEHIFAHREVPNPALAAATANGTPVTPTPAMPAKIREFYVKWTGRSYMHAEWVTEAKLIEMGFKKKMTNYLEKRHHDISEIEESELGLFFPQEYLEVDRIIACQPREEGLSPLYLVKWRQLSYTEATWETKEDIANDEKIREFERVNVPPDPAAIDQSTKTYEWKQIDAGQLFKNDNQLRSYQVEGMNWLLYCWHEHRGCVLADEMGLGKTIQAVTYINQLWTQYGLGPFLVIAPLSTLHHWYREFTGWTHMNVVPYHGSADDRAIIREYEWDYPGMNSAKSPRKFNVLLTTYEMLLAHDWMEIKNIRWASVVVDEAQRLKSTKSKLLSHLVYLNAMHKVLLTGTPLQNNTTELWTLLNFIEPKKFPSLAQFQAEFGKLESSQQVAKLHTLLAPHLLRRLKEHVEKSIPPKEETIIEVELTSIQRQFYRAMLDRNRGFLVKGTSGKNFPSLMNVVMQLRKICNHPFLIEGAEEREKAKITAQPRTPEYQKAMLDILINASGKLVLVDKLLPKLKAGGHRVLIFSQMIRVLDTLEQYLTARGYKYERIDGHVRGNDRQAAIDRFTRPTSDVFVFLLCTRAGGVGINLTTADTVIIYDSDWNPQNDIQAQARCHRIGQQRDVKVYRLLTKNTYEREMFERASMKLGLDHAVLSNIASSWDEGDLKKANKEASKSALELAKEIDALLRHGAYDIFQDDVPDTKFREEDIDQILQRAKVVRYDSQDAPEAKAQAASFSKATFTTGDSASMVDVHSDDFWQRVLPEEVNPENLLARLPKLAAQDEKSHQQFWNDLSGIVKEVLALWSSQRHVPDGTSLLTLRNLTKLLEDATTIPEYAAAFSPVQKNTLNDWLTKVSECGKRKRKAVDRISYDAAREEAANSPASAQARKFRRGEKGQKSAYLWTRPERRRVIDAFLSLGSGKWEQVQEIAKVPHKTLDEVRLFCNAFVRECLLYTTEDDAAFFRDLLDVKDDDSKQYGFSEPTISEPAFSEQLKKRVKGFKNKLKVVRTLNALRKRADALGGIDRVKVPQPRETEKKPVDWWTALDDRSLVHGSLKYGFGNYGLILRDPNLRWNKPLNATTTAAPTAVDEEDDEKDEEKDKDDDEEEALAAATETPGAAGAPQKSFDPRDPPKEQGWPPARLLDARVRVLLQQMGKSEAEVNRQREKDRRNAMRSSERLLRAAKKNWTRHEKLELKRVLLMYGRNWERIVMKAELHRPIEQLQEYCDKLIAHCLLLAARQPRKPLPEGVPAPPPPMENADGSLNIQLPEDELGPYDEFDEVVGDGEARKIEAREDDNAADDEDDDWTGPRSTRLAQMRPIQTKAAPFMFIESGRTARKVLSRIELMDELRERILPHAELDAKLKLAQRLDMPEWWISGEFDKLLLQNILYHGLGKTGYVKKYDHPFYKGEQNYEINKVKKKFLRDFLEDRHQLINHLKYLFKLVLEGPEQALAHFNGVGRKGSRFPSLQVRVVPRRTESVGGDGGGLQSMDSEPMLKLNLNFKLTTRHVPRDDNGKAILPITAKGATIVSLGTVVWDNLNFHSKSYIWPVGYDSTRRLPSLRDATSYSMWHSTIQDDNGKPVFIVYSEDEPDKLYKHHTSSGVWVECLKKIKRRQTVSVSGPEMYGFADPTVQMLIQELPNADKCANYQWKRFVSEAAPNDSDNSKDESDNDASKVANTSAVSAANTSVNQSVGLNNTSALSGANDSQMHEDG